MNRPCPYTGGGNIKRRSAVQMNLKKQKLRPRLMIKPSAVIYFNIIKYKRKYSQILNFYKIKIQFHIDSAPQREGSNRETAQKIPRSRPRSDIGGHMLYLIFQALLKTPRYQGRNEKRMRFLSHLIHGFYPYPLRKAQSQRR